MVRSISTIQNAAPDQLLPLQRSRANSDDTLHNFNPSPSLTPTINDQFISRSKFGDQDIGKPAEREGRVGKWLILLIVTCLILLAVSVGFLTWLWFGNRDSALWRSLISGAYNARSITLTGVAIRFSIATLAWITTAMIVSVVVEKHGVPWDKIAQASVARYTGAITPLILGGYAFRRWFAILVPLQFLCGIVSQFTSTLLFSDFDSGLVSGFRTQLTVNYQFKLTEKNGSMVYDDVSMPAVKTKWDMAPQLSEVFAEYAEPENRINDSSVDDTGPVWRAFLPIASEETRTGIIEYDGIARVFDARTVCANPRISKLGISGKSTSLPKFVGVGSLDLRSIPNLLDTGEGNVGNPASFPFYFECQMSNINSIALGNSTCSGVTDCKQARDSFPVWEECGVWSISDTNASLEDLVDSMLLPRIGRAADVPNRIPSLDPLSYTDAIPGFGAEFLTKNHVSTDTDPLIKRRDSFIDQDGPLARFLDGRVGRSFLLMNARNPGNNIFFASIDPVPRPKDAYIELPILATKQNGAWQEFSTVVDFSSMEFDNVTWGDDFLTSESMDLIPTENLDISTQATVCWDVFMPDKAPIRYFNVKATSGTNRSEPRSTWVQDEGRYDLTEVLKQLGVSKEPLSHADRGILSLARESIYDAIEREVKTTDIMTSTNISDFASDAVIFRSGLVFCPNCPFGDMDRYWDNLFRQALNETNSPARAIQAVYTAKARLGYMQVAAAYTHPEEAVVASLNVAQVPTRVIGYSLALAIIAIQLTLLVVAGAQFRRTRDSILGSAWLVISQVSSSPEVANVLAQAKTVTDDDVKQHIEAEKAVRAEGACDEWGQSSGRYVVYDGTFRRKL